MLNARNNILTCSQAYPVVTSRWNATNGIRNNFLDRLCGRFLVKKYSTMVFIAVSLWNPDFSIQNTNYNYFLSPFTKTESENLVSFAAAWIYSVQTFSHFVVERESTVLHLFRAYMLLDVVSAMQCTDKSWWWWQLNMEFHGFRWLAHALCLWWGHTALSTILSPKPCSLMGRLDGVLQSVSDGTFLFVNKQH